ncbi:MAG: UDP-N-acetylmuramate dehydrogenase [Bordetella sp.]|nr:MAG: UDP-N-acetylmuramate dehydrogenase [Bordetella sp.]
MKNMISEEKSLIPCKKNLQIFNTFGLHSIAQNFVTVSQISQLSSLSELASNYSRIHILGGGSNIILPEILDGLLIKVELLGINLIENRPKNRIIEIAAGELWHNIVANFTFNGWAGLENLALIPGTVGAAPIQNIGAYGVELSDYFHSLIAWDLKSGSMVHMDASDCQFDYRDSIFKKKTHSHLLILSVRLNLPKCWKPNLEYPDLKKFFKFSSTDPKLEEIFYAICSIRKAKLPDPNIIGNVGCFFKNPVINLEKQNISFQEFPDIIHYKQRDGRCKIFAGCLIEKCGWRGRSKGSVGVYKHQPLVLVNLGGAKAKEVIQLAQSIQQDVTKKYGIFLEIEPVII